MYLDDGIIAVNGTEKACIESAQVKLDLDLLLTMTNANGSRNVAWSGLGLI